MDDKTRTSLSSNWKICFAENETGASRILQGAKRASCFRFYLCCNRFTCFICYSRLHLNEIRPDIEKNIIISALCLFLTIVNIYVIYHGKIIRNKFRFTLSGKAGMVVSLIIYQTPYFRRLVEVV